MLLDRSNFERMGFGFFTLFHKIVQMGNSVVKKECLALYVCVCLYDIDDSYGPLSVSR